MNTLALDPQAAEHIAICTAGGYGHYWQKEGKRSTWWNGAGPPAPPTNRDLYFGVNPCAAQRSAGQRSTNATIAALNCLFAEFDAKDFSDSKPAALAHVQQLEPPPSVIIDSGGGYHAYWYLLSSHQLANEAERARARELLALWVAYTGGDTGAKDLARVLRVPGTFNAKYTPARPVYFERFDPSTRYDLAELAAYCAEPAAPAIELGALSTAPSATPRPALSDDLAARRAALWAGAALDKEITAVRSAGQGKRNSTLNDAALRLSRIAAAGLLDQADTQAALYDAALAAGLASAEIRATLASGWAKGQSEGPPRDLPDFTKDDRPAQAAPTVGGPAAAPSTAAPAGVFGEHRTDLGNAGRLVRLYGDRIRYVHSWGEWLIWDGGRWVKDETKEIYRLARNTVRTIYAEATASADSAERKALASWAMASESVGKLRAMVELAESEPGIAVHHTALDAAPWLLNCRNGTIDLRTGQLLPHDRAQLLTKQTDVDYDPAATAPLWLRFIERITDSNPELAAYMQRAAGYTLTGDVSEQCLFFCYGNGANGKSTYVETLAALLGSFWLKAPSDMLMQQRAGAATNDLARLEAARMVVASELSDGRRLDEARVKDLTGEDTIAARFLHREFFTFRPVFKLWVYGNHKPQIKGTDNGIWRRIRLIPFTATIPDSEKDPALRSKLRAELGGILAWAVRGCLAWQAEGLTPPAVVKAATDAYRTEMDAIGAFLLDSCTTGPRCSTSAGELYKAYSLWCEEGGEHAVSQRRFGQQLAERGYERYRGTGNVHCWRGIALLDPALMPSAPPSAGTPHAPTNDSDPSDPSDPDLTKSETIQPHEENYAKKGHLGHLGHSAEPTAALPPGWRVVRADHDGTPRRYGVYRVAMGPEGQVSEPTQHEDEAIRDAWRFITAQKGE